MSWTLDDDFINEMEVLLLDTTQKESEDNFIYHYAFENVKENSFTSNRLIKIRGALATAARTCTTLCDEEITLLHLKNEQKQKDYTIGYIDLKETLFLMIFPSKIPHNIIQYYTKSTCDLLLSIFGFPGVKLKAWQHQKEEEHQQDDPNTALVFALDAILEEIFQQITKELSFKSTSLQFVFDGANTSLNLPLSLMRLLVSSDVDILGTENSLRKKDHKDFALIGRCILVDGLLVVSSMPLQYRSLFTQWFSVQSKVQPFTQVSLPYLKEKEGTLRHKWYQFYPYQIASHAKVHPNLFLLSTCEDSLQVLNLYKYTCPSSSLFTLPHVHLDEQIQATNSLVTTLIEKIHLVSTIHDFKKKITLELLLTKDQTIALIWDTTRHLVLGGLLPFTFTNQMEYDTHKSMLQALLSHFGCRSRRLRNTSTTRSNLSNTETVGLDFESNPLIYVPKAHINMDSQDISHQRGSMNSFIAMKQLPIQSTRSFRLPLSSSSSSSSSNHQFLWIYQKYSNGMEYIAASISCSNSSNSNISNNIESSWTKLTTYR